MKCLKRVLWIGHALLLATMLRVYAGEMITPSAPEIVYSGRMYHAEDASVQFAYSGARIRMSFRAESIGILLEDLNRENWVNVYLDGQFVNSLTLDAPEDFYLLAEGLNPDEVHTIEIVKATEGFIGSCAFRGFELSDGGVAIPFVSRKEPKIEFIGDSITCGYGIEADGPDGKFLAEEENFCETYAWHTVQALQADYLVVARSGIGMFRNYNGPHGGSSGAMPEIYDQVFFRSRMPKWDFSEFKPDVVCINLGTNDFSTSGVDADGYENAYLQFAKRLHEQQPQAKLVFLMGPMRNSEALKMHLQRVMTQLNAEVGADVASFFAMSPQGKYGFGTHYHPSKEQGRVNGEELARYLADLLALKL